MGERSIVLAQVFAGKGSRRYFLQKKGAGRYRLLKLTPCRGSSALLWSFAALVFSVVFQVGIALDASEFHLLVGMAIRHGRLPVPADVPAGRPRLRIDVGIGDGGFVDDRVRVLWYELLGHVEGISLEVSRGVKPSPGVLIGGIHYQGVPFPVPHWIALEQFNF